MTNLSWNEIQDRAAEFASKWQGETYEKGESQSFWGDFLAIYGIDRRRHGAFFVLAVFYGVMQMLLMIMLIANTDNTTKAVERLAKQMADYSSKDFDVS